MTLDERRCVAAAARRYFPGKVIVNVSACALGDVHTLLDHCMSDSEVRQSPALVAAAMHAPPLPAACGDGRSVCS